MTKSVSKDRVAINIPAKRAEGKEIYLIFQPWGEGRECRDDKICIQGPGRYFKIYRQSGPRVRKFCTLFHICIVIE